MKTVNILILLVICAFLFCSTNDNLAGGSETGNPVVAGYVYNNDQSPSIGTIVTLTTNNYFENSSSIKDTIYKDTTDNNGFYLFNNVLLGSYNIKAVNDSSKTVSFTEDIELFDIDTFEIYDTLDIYSYIELILPNNIDTANQYLFIEGTDYYYDLHDAYQIETGEWLLIIDGLPNDICLNLYILDINDSELPILIDSFSIDQPGDTLKLGTFDISKVYNKSNSKLTSNTITSLLLDHNSNFMWIGTYQGGLLKWDLSLDTMTLYNTSNSDLSDNYITTLALDSAGRLFIGTHQGGLNIYNGTNWKNYTDTDIPEMGNTITALEISPNNKCLIGTPKAFIKFDYDSIIIEPYNNLIPDDGITSIAVIDDNDYWLGTSYSGLINIYYDTAYFYDSYDNDFPDNYITALEKDSKGNIWIGTIYGVSKIDTNRFITTEILDNSGALDIYSIYEDMHGFIWFGLQGDPTLLRYDGNNYREYCMNCIDLENNPGSINSLIEINNSYFVATEYTGIIVLNEDLKRREMPVILPKQID